VHTTALLAGLLFGLSLIVVIGAQNTYVLRVGLLREHVLPVVAICTVSDAALIAAGVSGAGAAVDGRPELLQLIRWAGAAFLLSYGALAARRALRTATVPQGAAPQAISLASAVGAAVALTWLNPGVYLDTVVLLGSVANTRPGGHAWWFGGGAALGSLLWFTGLGFGARLLAGTLQSPAAWRVLDALVALVMVATALRVLVA
jgi:L-lysine exporter family protein LysE/ArgO